MWPAIIAVLASVVVLLLGFIVIYNSLIGRRNRAHQAFSTIDVMFQQRCDLIPSLIDAVKAYMQHENEILTKLTELRTQAMAPGAGVEDRAAIDSELRQLLGRLMVQVEGYPQLKASENFLQLQRSLNEVEAQLAAARRTYNAAATDLNNAVEMFPTSVVAALMRCRRRRLLEAGESDRRKPDVGRMLRN
jgi:LemA protein